MAISRRCNACMRVLWLGEDQACPYCGAILNEVGVWTDEPTRKLLAPGQIQLVYSGDDDCKYTIVKLIWFDGDSLWVKICKDNFAIRPEGYDPQVLTGGFVIVPISVDTLLAWGPPTFPILIAQEPVYSTRAEMA